jgi:hypothetical protein
MFINAELIEKMIQVELPLNSSDLFFLEQFLKSNGFKFDRKIGKFKYTCYDESNTPHTIFWHMRSTLNNTIVCTFIGKKFPYEENLRKIVYPKKPHCSYILELDREKITSVIKTLFNNEFEIAELSEGGENQLYRRKNNKVLLSQSERNSGRVRMTFSGFDNVSRSILSSFSIS